ncbi:phage-type endonuclease [Thermoanaerobacter italicus Ab9]|jgi:putative phage-type endonuclease|uniref:Phage-type endonuclease n=3 Tax=Thermoanaerobacter TaxID=1754 RepID=D3T363_THEIA|nr:YqaJ viral recombinase family protein [Thermoanaerobacter italicus]ADD02665.1 phage-type endonuclease [Thermoanaerobacter italicus Ab9]
MQASVLVKTKNMDRNEWLQWRKKGIGGSDAAAVAGLNPWKSPIEVYLEKIGEIPEPEDNEKMYWGRILEDIVAKEFTLRTGKKVRRRNFMLRHPKYEFMIANIDRELVGEKVGLECKTVSEYGKSEWEGDKVPDQYIIQCQHYMAVTGYEGWWIAALIGGNKFIYKYIKRDEEIIQYLIKIESDFWKMVEERTPPPLDGSKSSENILKLLYPEAAEGTEIELPEEVEELIVARENIKAQIKKLETKQLEIENKIKAMLKENEVGRTPKYIVSWKTYSRTSIDSKKLKIEQPEIYEKYLQVSTYRKFDVREVK